MLKAGWPIVSMTLVFEALWWVDRLVVLKLFGITHFGYYGFASMVAQLCFLFPAISASVIEPRIYFDYARSGQRSQIKEHLWFLLRTQAVVLPLFLAGIDLLTPPFIHRFLPAYAAGIPAMRILIWGNFFMGLTICTKSFIVAVEKQRQVLPFYFAAIGVNLVASVFLGVNGWGLTGVALGTATAYCLCCAGLLFFSFRQLEWSFKRVLAHLGGAHDPLGDPLEFNGSTLSL